MKSRKRMLASALAAASLAVGSKAQGLDRSTLLKCGVGVAVLTGLVSAVTCNYNYLVELFSKYGIVDKVGEAVKKLASGISVRRGYYYTGYSEAPRGYLRVSCGGQNWFVCFVKDVDKKGFAALCGKECSQLVGTVNKLKLFEKLHNNDYDLVLNKDGLSEQIKEFTRCVVNSLSPTASENFKNAVCEGLYPVMLDRVWDTFSEGQAYFAASSDQASAIARTAKHNYNDFALSID